MEVGAQVRFQAVLEAAAENFEQLAQQTMQRLRAAAEEELLASQAVLAQKEEALQQREERLLEREQLAAKLEHELQAGRPDNVFASTPTPTRAPAQAPGTAASNQSPPCVSEASAGSASQLRAMFERKVTQGGQSLHEPQKAQGSRSGTPRKELPAGHSAEERGLRLSCPSERRGEASRLSFRAQEGPLRRSNSGASLAESKHEPLQMASPLSSPQPSQASPTPSLLMSPSAAQAPQPSGPSGRPPLSPTKKKRPTAPSPQPTPERVESARTDERPQRPTLQPAPERLESARTEERPQRPTLQPAPKRSLADLLKMDEAQNSL